MHVLLATGRPAVAAFFAGLPEWSHLPFEVHAIAPTEVVAGRGVAHFADAVLAIVDTAYDPSAAIGLCQEIRQARPELRVAALLCCSQPFAPWHLQELAAAGVRGMLDLQASQEEAVRTLISLAGGSGVLHVQLDREHAAYMRDVMSGRWPTVRPLQDSSVLELVSRGLSDREIGSQLNLSPHTVSHRVVRLRDAAGVRNRIELAAWAGRYGFYRPPSNADTEAGRTAL